MTEEELKERVSELSQAVFDRDDAYSRVKPAHIPVSSRDEEVQEL
jgi:hypothetical protein